MYVFIGLHLISKWPKWFGRTWNRWPVLPPGES